MPNVRSAPVIRECFTGESFANKLFEQAANPTWNLFQRHRLLLKASQTLSGDRTTHIKRVLARSTPDKCNIGACCTLAESFSRKDNLVVWERRDLIYGLTIRFRNRRSMT